MVNVFVIFGCIAMLAGIVIWAGSKSAIHEIAALVSFLIGWLLFVGAALLSAILNVGRQICERLPKPRTAPPPYAHPAPVPPPAPEPTIPAPRQVNPNVQ